MGKTSLYFTIIYELFTLTINIYQIEIPLLFFCGLQEKQSKQANINITSAFTFWKDTVHTLIIPHFG